MLQKSQTRGGCNLWDGELLAFKIWFSEWMVIESNEQVLTLVSPTTDLKQKMSKSASVGKLQKPEKQIILKKCLTAMKHKKYV